MGESDTTPLVDGSPQITPSESVVSVSTRIPKRRKFIPLLILIILLVILVIIFVVLSLNHKKKPASLVLACSTSSSATLLSEAANSFSTNNLSQQKQIAKEIQALKNYKQDPSCLYVVDFYFVNAGDLSDAQNYLTDFNKAYNEHPELSKALAYSSSNGAKALRKAVNNLESGVNQAQRNTVGL